MLLSVKETHYGIKKSFTINCQIDIFMCQLYSNWDTFVGLSYICWRETMNFLSVTFAPPLWPCLGTPITIPVYSCLLIGPWLIHEAHKPLVMSITTYGIRRVAERKRGSVFCNIRETYKYFICRVPKIIDHLFETQAGNG
jgi:hypothetical protein